MSYLQGTKGTMCNAQSRQPKTRQHIWLQVTPLLNELRSGNLVGNLEALTKSASEAASDIHRLQTEVTSIFHCGTYLSLLITSVDYTVYPTCDHWPLREWLG